jgi:sugar-phosphate isomerases, RpiB/LacA/LacB family
MKKVVIASDHGAVALKNEIVSFLKTKNCAVKDLGVNSEDSVDYPDVAVAACNEFKKGGYDFGILLCGSGIGMSIVANKIKGIRCAQVFDLFTAEMAKAHNNANFIAFGGRVKYSVPVSEMIEKFMNTIFSGDRHERRIAKIMAIEKSDC